MNQGPENSSRPPSSRVPWERKGGARESDTDAGADAADSECEPEPAALKSAEPKQAEVQLAEPKPARKAGKQPGHRGWAERRCSKRMHNRPTRDLLVYLDYLERNGLDAQLPVGAVAQGFYALRRLR